MSGRRLDQGAKPAERQKKRLPRNREPLGADSGNLLSFFLAQKRSDYAKKGCADQRRAYLFKSIKNQKYPTDSENEADGKSHPEGGHALAMLVFFQLDGPLMRRPLRLMRRSLILFSHSENSVRGSGQKLLQPLHDGGRWYGPLIEYFLCVPDSRL